MGSGASDSLLHPTPQETEGRFLQVGTRPCDWLLPHWVPRSWTQMEPCGWVSDCGRLGRQPRVSEGQVPPLGLAIKRGTCISPIQDSGRAGWARGWVGSSLLSQPLAVARRG